MRTTGRLPTQSGFRRPRPGPSERRQGDRQARQHEIAKAIAGEMHVAAGWSVSASVDPYPNDFCVRGMAAPGLVRSVRSVMVAQCSSGASAEPSRIRYDGRISRREVSSAAAYQPRM